MVKKCSHVVARITEASNRHSSNSNSPHRSLGTSFTKLVYTRWHCVIEADQSTASMEESGWDTPADGVSFRLTLNTVIILVLKHR